MRYMRSEPRVTVRHAGEILIFDIIGYFTEDSAEGINAAYDQSADASKFCFALIDKVLSPAAGLVSSLS